MFVARVVVSGSRRESWTVVGEDGQLVEPAERFLSFLTDAGRSPNTVKAYAHDLRDWFAFLAGRALDWAAVSVEDGEEVTHVEDLVEGGFPAHAGTESDVSAQ